MPKLFITEDGGESVYEIFEDEVTLGRGAANSVQIHDAHASKMHAVIRRLRGHWKLIDLESKNGVRVNGAFRNQHWLREGDVLAIGTSAVRYAAEGAPEGSPASAAGVAVKPQPARPAPARAAVAAQPARPATPALPPRQARPAPAESPLQGAAMPTPAAPAPQPAAAPARRAAPAVARKRRRSAQEGGYDDEGYDDEGPSPRARTSNSSAIVIFGALAAVGFLALMFAMFGPGMSTNEEVRIKADRMADKRDYEGALRYAEQNADPSGEDYPKLLRFMANWKKRLKAQKDLEQSAAARTYFDRQIFRQQAITGRRKGGFRARDALPDSEVVKLLRDFLLKHRGTATAAEILHSDTADNRHFREAMREYADPEVKSTQVLQAQQAQLDIDVSARRYGKAVQDLEYVRDMYRLVMTPENYAELRKAVELKLQEVLDHARSTLRSESAQFNTDMNQGRRGPARRLLEQMKEQYEGIDELSRTVRELEQRF